MNTNTAQARQVGGAAAGQVHNADGAVFLKGHIGLAAIGADRHILRFQILGGRGAALAGDADPQGPQFRLASVESLEVHRGNSGAGRCGGVDGDDGDRSLRVHRVELVRFPFVGDDQLCAIRCEGERIGHNSHGHFARSGHACTGSAAADLEEGNRAFGIALCPNTLHSNGHQSAAAHRHAVGQPAQIDDLLQERCGWVAEINDGEFAAAPDRENKPRNAVVTTDLSSPYR